MKPAKKAFFIFGGLVILALVVRLVYAAFSGTRRLVGEESRFESVTVTGHMQIGSAGTAGSIYYKPHDVPSTCDSTTKGSLYADDSENCMKLCNGTAWTSLCQ